MWSSRTIRSGRADRGFVLATTLLVTTLLTVMLAASFLLVSAEQRTTDNSFGTARALSLAQVGLQYYFSLNTTLADTSTYDSVRVTLANGYADVVAQRVRPGGAVTGSPLALYVVRSTGVATSPVMAGQVQGNRTIAQFAQLNPANLPARAGMVALNGVDISGAGSNPLNGHDLGSISPCTSPGSPVADTHSVSLPVGGYSANAGAAPLGTIESFATWNQLYDSTHVDWGSLVSGNLIPDYTIPPASYPPYSDNYQVGYVPGDATIPNGQRRGVLVVTGNVTMANGAHWDGIILAGGTVSAQTVASTFIIHGMIVTGLNMALGQAVAKNPLKRANANIEWTWCYTRSSINSLSSLVPLKNGWADTWTTY